MIAKTKMIVNCLQIHIWGHMRIYARKYRKTYYRMLSL